MTQEDNCHRGKHLFCANRVFSSKKPVTSSERFCRIAACSSHANCRSRFEYQTTEDLDASWTKTGHPKRAREPFPLVSSQGPWFLQHPCSHQRASRRRIACDTPSNCLSESPLHCPRHDAAARTSTPKGADSFRQPDLPRCLSPSSTLFAGTDALARAANVG